MYVKNATENWLDLLTEVMQAGQQVTVRGRNITEVLNRQATIDMQQPIVSCDKRKLGLAFMYAEAAWILSGRNDVKSIAQYAKNIANFSDDGEFFQGAYGPQIVQQLPYIIHSFVKDLYTRQAVISIWKPSPPESRDIPCTLTCQFMVRGTLLHCFVNMRSSDAWLGIPYDWFNFSMLSGYLLELLKPYHPNLELGFLHFNAASQHIYNDDIPKVLTCLEHSDPDDRVSDFEYPQGPNFVSQLWERAQAYLSCV